VVQLVFRGRRGAGSGISSRGRGPNVGVQMPKAARKRWGFLMIQVSPRIIVFLVLVCLCIQKDLIRCQFVFGRI